MILVICIAWDHHVPSGGLERETRRLVLLIVGALAFEVRIDGVGAPGLGASETDFDKIRREPAWVHCAP